MGLVCSNLNIVRWYNKQADKLSMLNTNNSTEKLNDSYTGVMVVAYVGGTSWLSSPFNVMKFPTSFLVFSLSPLSN